MIKYNNNTINDWNFGDDNIVKVYRNGAVVFYKFDSEQGGYKVCYAVVEDISQYSETEFTDVYNLADEKWYKLNNLNQYEEYGVYGNSISSGGTSRLPDGYTEVEYIENTQNGKACIDTNYIPNQDTRILCSYQSTYNSQYGRIWGSGTNTKTNAIMINYEGGVTYQLRVKWAKGSNWTTTSVYGDYNVHTYDFNKNNLYFDGTLVSTTSYTTFQSSDNIALFAYINNGTPPFSSQYQEFAWGKMFYCKIYDNDILVRDFVPCIRDNDSVAGMYDLVNNVFYPPVNYTSYQFVAGSAVTPTAATYYEGKLAIVDGYEYQYSGGSWVNVGEVSGSTATLPNVPFTVNFNAKNYNSSTKTLLKTSGQLADVDAVITAGTPTVHDGYLTIASGTRATIEGYQTYFNRDNSNPNLTIISKQRTEGSYCHMFANRDSNYNWMYRCYATKLTLHGSSESGQLAVTTQPVIESVRVEGNSSVRSVTYNNYTNNTTSSTNVFNYGSTNSGKFALFQGYATTTGENFVGDFYWVYMSQNTLTDDQVQQVIDYNEGGGGQTEYPLYYDEIADPLNNLSFNTMDEAVDYAYNNCVYDGMRATIGGDRYYFDSEDENGWVKILSYYNVEDVTSGGASGWTITGSSTYNPQPSYYDDFSLETNSTSNSYKIAKVTIFGYDNFTYYLRSFNGWSSSYCYLMASNVDELQSDPISMSYNSNSAVTNTYGFNKTAGSAVNLSNYRRVTYNNLDKTVEHTFYVVFYGRTYSNYVSNATILIPKEQTNENWEQVTFSSSTNVASVQKNLYIDNNTSTSYWYYRWIIGLPSGSHSSYVSYSSYDYCPNTTSSTFTSVAGEQRQVNFTYDSTSNKSLQFRLVDTSGNTITPSDTVYYNMTYYNACNTSSSSSNVTFPRSQSVKVGGRFRFANSSNRHYIYGYSPSISLNYDYYVDNYNTYFDITYTKLNTEAVTITYTTYDPNDAEVPAFKTDITYPYNGGTTSSTTLTSYDVPYTYSYEVKQTSNLFSASTASYSYTAGQATRTITFTLYPNNRTFSTVADMEAYAYAWEGMKASVNGTNYKYTNGSWVEQSYTQYEYIQTQASKIYDINTNFYPTTAYTIETKFEMNTQSVDWGRIICWTSCNGDSCDASQFRFTTVTSGYAIIARLGNTSGTSYKTIGSGKTITVTMPLSATSGTYNSGTTDYSFSYNYASGWGSNLPSSTAMHIFSLGGSNVSDNTHSACVKMYYIKIYDANHNLVKHYVPSDYSGTPCFYELIDGDYILDTYTGSNHGTLTLGPEV